MDFTLCESLKENRGDSIRILEFALLISFSLRKKRAFNNCELFKGEGLYAQG